MAATAQQCLCRPLILRYFWTALNDSFRLLPAKCSPLWSHVEVG